MALPTQHSLSVSVAIPAYNCAATLQRAIDSVLAQTYREFELLIVDDYSIDATPEILAQQTDPRIRVIRHEANLGESGARNTCFQEARYQWLAFLDSDDEWFPDKLNVQLNALRGIKQNDFCAVFVPYERFNLDDDTCTTICETTANDGGDWGRHFLGQCGIGAGTTMLTSKAAYSRVGPYDTRLKRRTDHDWLLRFTVAGGQIVQLGGEPLARVYFTAKTQPEAIALATDIFFEKHSALYAAQSRTSACKAKASLLFQIAESLQINRRYREWLTTIAWCLWLDPSRALPEILKMADRCVGRPVARSRRWLRKFRSETRSPV